MLTFEYPAGILRYRQLPARVFGIYAGGIL